MFKLGKITSRYTHRLHIARPVSLTGSASRLFSTRSFNPFSNMESHQIDRFSVMRFKNLHAIIAFAEHKDSTVFRPALGGFRFVEYDEFESAVKDVFRLAQGMSEKAGGAGLDLAGAKAVALKPKNLTKELRKEIMSDFGQWVETMNGQYITAMDSGTTVKDMDIIRRYTQHVASHSAFGDPSPYTSRGIFESIKTTLSFYEERSLQGLTVAIQGAGGTGYHLAKLLDKAGVKLTVSDTDSRKAKRIAEEFKAEIVDPKEIHTVSADVFSPCALGAVLNAKTIPEMKARFVVGSANNQLDTPKTAQLLTLHGIRYAPDFIVNSAGLIHCVAKYYEWPDEKRDAKIAEIGKTLQAIFSGARNTNKTTAEYARLYANAKIEATLATGSPHFTPRR